MLEGLTVILAVIVTLGVVVVVTSEHDRLILTNGIMFVVFGTTALFWAARGTVPYLHEGSAVRWLYTPLATLPEWVGYTGIAVTAILLATTIVFLVDDYVHLPRRKGGRR